MQLPADVTPWDTTGDDPVAVMCYRESALGDKRSEVS
jgi:hypothetical protein